MDIYLSQLKSNAKGTKLNLTTHFPNKSCMEDTLKFVRHVTQVWNMLNKWSCYSGSCLNDPDRKPFKSCNDSRLDFVLQWHKRSGRQIVLLKEKGTKGLINGTVSILHETVLGKCSLSENCQMKFIPMFYQKIS